MAQQLVLPIKDSNILKSVQETLLDSFRAGGVITLFFNWVKQPYYGLVMSCNLENLMSLMQMGQ